jgi:hypothetical protein
MSHKKGDKCNEHSLTTGRDSKLIKELQSKLGTEPLKAVDQFTWNTYLDYMKARIEAYETDSYIKKLLIEKAKDIGGELISAEADLAGTQVKIAEYEKDMIFHIGVLQDMKEQYLATKDVTILDEIDKREKQVQQYQRLVNDLLELRAKIRKDMQGTKLQEKALRLREKEVEDKVKIKSIDVDFTVLDELPK